jgi:hypothetical protein
MPPNKKAKAPKRGPLLVTFNPLLKVFLRHKGTKSLSLLTIAYFKGVRDIASLSSQSL